MLDRRKFLGLLGATGLTFGLAACSSDDTTDETEDTTEEESEDSEETESDEAEAEEEEAEEVEEETEEEAEPVDVRTVALKGPTAMGLVQFMSEADAGNLTDNNYTFDIVASSDEVTPLLTAGDVDIAALPANLAAVLYNGNDAFVRVIAINTLGVLYICELGDEIQTVSDLAGKTIYASGKGSTPEYALNYILEQNGLTVGTDVTVEWKSEHSECVTAIVEDQTAIAMLPQPFVTTAQMSNENIRVALDLTEEWDALQENADEPSALITGVAVVRSEFADENPAAVEAFLEHYEESVDYVNNNVDEAAALVGEYDIVTEEVAQTAIPECNIVCITGEDMKEQLSGYLAVLLEQDEDSVGGALPGDDFYYGA